MEGIKIDQLYHADALEFAQGLPDGCLDSIVTSPPYWNLRDYGDERQIGLEKTPQLYVERMVILFRELYRALKPFGTCWVNMGDSYNNTSRLVDPKRTTNKGKRMPQQSRGSISTLPPKNLLMIPARLAIALQDDGWILRSEILWKKPNPMPESVKDRPTYSHEWIYELGKTDFYPLYFLVKNERYYYNHLESLEPMEMEERIKREAQKGMTAKFDGKGTYGDHSGLGFQKGSLAHLEGRNMRDVWEIKYEPTAHNHYATYPTEIPKRCILLGCPEGGLVYDPFMGSGTTALVARALGCHYLGTDVNKDYLDIAEQRLGDPQEYIRFYRKQPQQGGDKPVDLGVVQKGLFGDDEIS